MEVDWNHPLSGGLVGCYVPGGYAGLQDLTGIGPTLEINNLGSNQPTPEGYGYACVQSNSSASASTIPDVWNITNGGTLFWRGIATGPTGFVSGFDVTLLGITLGGDPINVSPPTVAIGFTVISSFAGHKIGFYYKPSDLTQRSVLSPQIWENDMIGLPVAIAASFTVNGAINLYVWSVSTSTPPRSVPNVTAGLWGTGEAPDSTQFWNFSIGVPLSMDGYDSSSTVTTSAYLYDRALSASELSALNASPFAMLRPVARRLRNSLPATGNPFRLWNRTYLIR